MGRERQRRPECGPTTMIKHHPPDGQTHLSKGNLLPEALGGSDTPPPGAERLPAQRPFPSFFPIIISGRFLPPACSLEI